MFHFILFCLILHLHVPNMKYSVCTMREVVKKSMSGLRLEFLNPSLRYSEKPCNIWQDFERYFGSCSHCQSLISNFQRESAVAVEMLRALCEFWEQEKHAVFLKFGQLYLSRAAKCICGHCMNLEIWGYTGMGIGNEFQEPEKHKHISTFASVCNPLPVEKDKKYITAMNEQPYIFL